MLTEARFEGALHVECELPDDLRALRLPPLILQPIVENAVRHGFVAVDDRRVAISIRQDDKRAYIRVSDQGQGFPPEVLKKLEDPNDPTYTGLFTASAAAASSTPSPARAIPIRPRSANTRAGSASRTFTASTRPALSTCAIFSASFRGRATASPCACAVRTPCCPSAASASANCAAG